MIKLRPVGDVIDARGVTFELADDDLITDVVVIINVLGSDGRSWICGRAGDGTDVLMEEGMLSRGMKQLDVRWQVAARMEGDD